MLKIRLQRIGRTNSPAFRVIVTEHTNGPKAGKAVEHVGFYNPRSKERQLDAERIQYWLSKGAQASGTVHNMLVSTGILKGVKKINILPKKTVPKKEEAVASEAKPEVKTEAAPVEVAVEEVPAEVSAQA